MKIGLGAWAAVVDLPMPSVPKISYLGGEWRGPV